ncbi:MAG: hypothetical protein KIS67_06955 [Verrucomicrobiae bacterium]|nr:hypothetical protein [Verrucomicrobiae bacterium]
MQVAETFVVQVTAQAFALGVLSGGHVEEYEPPLAIPGPRPLHLWVAPAEDVQSPLRGEPVKAVGGSGGVALQELLALQGGDLAQQAVAIRPAFVGVGEVAKGRPHEQVRRPEQEVQEFLGLGLHGGSIAQWPEKRNATFCCICNKRLPASGEDALLFAIPSG